MTTEPPRQTTKVCPDCRNDKLVRLSSQNVKLCPDCKIEIPWYLELNQKKII